MCFNCCAKMCFNSIIKVSACRSKHIVYLTLHELHHNLTLEKSDLQVRESVSKPEQWNPAQSLNCQFTSGLVFNCITSFQNRAQVLFWNILLNDYSQKVIWINPHEIWVLLPYAPTASHTVSVHPSLPPCYSSKHKISTLHFMLQNHQAGIQLSYSTAITLFFKYPEQKNDRKSPCPSIARLPTEDTQSQEACKVNVIYSKGVWSL